MTTTKSTQLVATSHRPPASPRRVYPRGSKLLDPVALLITLMLYSGTLSVWHTSPRLRITRLCLRSQWHFFCVLATSLTATRSLMCLLALHVHRPRWLLTPVLVPARRVMGLVFWFDLMSFDVSLDWWFYQRALLVYKLLFLPLYILESSLFFCSLWRLAIYCAPC